MLVVQQRVPAAEQHDRGKEVPLEFQPGVRTVVEKVTHGGVTGADQYRNQRKPGCPAADQIIERIDKTRDL